MTDRGKSFAARMAMARLLGLHGGCIEDALAHARTLQLRYSPGTESWEHYALVHALIAGGPMLHNEEQLREWVREVYQGYTGTPLDRLRTVVTTMGMVSRRGPNQRRDTEVKLSVMLAKWGAARTVIRFGVVAEEAERHG